jgi:hypothetical protein
MSVMNDDQRTHTNIYVSKDAKEKLDELVSLVNGRMTVAHTKTAILTAALKFAIREYQDGNNFFEKELEEK